MANGQTGVAPVAPFLPQPVRAEESDMTTNGKKFETIAVRGGCIQHRPAGVFTNEEGKAIDYQEAIRMDYYGKTYVISLPAAAALYDEIRANKDLQALLGVKGSLL